MYKRIPASETQILKAVRKGSSTGWELFFKEYDPMIRAIAKWPKWRFSADEQDDVCQNVHVQLQSALPTFKQQSSLSWFIKRIAIRQCINEVRRQIRWRTILLPASQQSESGDWTDMEFSSPDSPDPYDDLVEHERHRSLHSTLKQMQKTCRDSISMFYLQHLSYRQIAETLGISVATVGSRLSKCLTKLKKEFGKKPDSERISR